MKTPLRIFVACTNDLAAERKAVADAADDLAPIAAAINIELVVMDWRATLPGMGRPQQVILDQLKPTDWDLFIGILWHRFGTRPGKSALKGQLPASGTEEEFRAAYALWKHKGRPRMMLYRCHRPIPTGALDIEQYSQVKKFFSGFGADGRTPGLIHKFDKVGALRKLLRHHLGRFMMEYSKSTGTFVPQVVTEEFESDFVNNLPRRSSFFGRTKDMEAALVALSPEERSWGLVLDGIGGIGKTALAVEAAHRCLERKLFDNFVFVSAKKDHLETGSIRKEATVAMDLNYFLDETARLFHRQHLTELPLADKQRALREHLRDSKTLLIFDNLETLGQDVQEQMATFLRNLPDGCKAIITSRRRGGEGAIWRRLGDLDWDDAKQIIADQMKRYEWLCNQLQRVGEARWQELYELAGRAPLALIWCLGRIRIHRRTFDEALKAIREGDINELDLREFMFGEHRNMDESQKAVLCAVSFFVPSATVEALMEVSHYERTAMTRLLDRLTAVSLVAEELGPEDRFKLNELTKAWVIKELAGNHSYHAEFRERFCRYWLGYARRYGATARDSYRTFDRLDAEWTNIHAASELLLATCLRENSVIDPNLAGLLNEFAEVLGAYLVCRGKWDMRLQLSESAYITESSLKNWDGAFWRAYDVTWVYLQRGQADLAQQWNNRYTVAANLSVNKPKNLAFAKRLEGLTAWINANYISASRLLTEALTTTNMLQLDDEAARILNDLVMLHCDFGAYVSAAELFPSIEFLLTKQISREEQCRSWLASGTIALLKRDWAKASASFVTAWDHANDLGRPDLKGKVRIGLSQIAEARGESAQAIEFAKEALHLFTELRHRDLPSTQNRINRLMVM